MSGYGLHRKIFPLPSPVSPLTLQSNPQPNTPYPTTTAKPSSTHQTQTQTHPQPAPAPNTSWPPFCDGIDLPPPYLTEKDCIPYHETGKYCPHCICFVRGQGRERGHGGGMFQQRGSMFEMDVDLDGDGDIEMCISEGFKRLREVDMSCNRRKNAVVEVGIGGNGNANGNGKRRMDMDMDMDVRDEDASPMKKLRYV